MSQQFLHKVESFLSNSPADRSLFTDIGLAVTMLSFAWTVLAVLPVAGAFLMGGLPSAYNAYGGTLFTLFDAFYITGTAAAYVLLLDRYMPARRAYPIGFAVLSTTLAIKSGFTFTGTQIFLILAVVTVGIASRSFAFIERRAVASLQRHRTTGAESGRPAVADGGHDDTR